MRIGRRQHADDPGVVGPARVARRGGPVDLLVDRLGPGDVAVVDLLDLDRASAEKLAAARVAAVVNASPSSSGRFPVAGPRVLVDAGVVLVDDVGREVLRKVRDGEALRIEGGDVWAGDERVASGHLQTAETVDESLAAAQDGLHTRVAALVADAGRRLGSAPVPEIDGTTFPELSTELGGRVVVVVAAAAEDAEVRLVRRRLRGRRTVVVGVGEGADRLAALGVRPDLVVLGRDARPASLDRRVGEVLVLDGADLDVPVPTGVPRAHTTAVGSALDTTVLLAHERGAALVVTCGVDDSIGGLLDRSSAAGSVPLLVRLRGGGAQVDASALASLPRRRVGRPRPGRVGAVAAAALVVGLLAGAGPAEPAVERLLPGPADESTAPVARDDDLVAAIAGADELQGHVVAGRLDGRTVNVVTLPGAPDAEPVLSALSGAGAGIGGVLRLTDLYLDPARGKVVRDLATQLGPADLAEELEDAPAGSDPAAQTDAVLASALVATDEDAVGAVRADTQSLLEGLSRMDAVVLPEQELAAADHVVVLVPTTDERAATRRAVTLVAALAEATGRVVVAGAGADGVISALRGGDGEADDDGAEAGEVPDVSTVDHVATATGRVALVLALEALAEGADPAHFGTADDASAPAADLTR